MVSSVYTFYKFSKPSLEEDNVKEDLENDNVKKEENISTNFENLPPLPPPLFYTSTSPLKKGLFSTILRF